MYPSVGWSLPEAWTSLSWPSHTVAMVRASRRVTSVPRSAEISEALANRKSPVRMATVLSHRALTDGTPCLVVASSMTSSWYRVATCVSSMAVAPSIRRRSDGSPK